MTALPDCSCPADGTRVPEASLAWCCPVCGGPLDLDFAPTPAPLKALGGRVNSLWRYEESPAPAGPAGLARRGPDPARPAHGRRLGQARLPDADALLQGPWRGDAGRTGPRLDPGRVIADSSGNAGTAVAAYCARAGLPCTVYVPEGTSPKKMEQIRAHGARLEVVPGDREAAAAAAREAAGRAGHLLRLARLQPVLPARHQDVRLRDLGRPRRHPPGRHRRAGRQRHPAPGRGPRHRGTALGEA